MRLFSPTSNSLMQVKSSKRIFSFLTLLILASTHPNPSLAAQNSLPSSLPNNQDFELNYEVDEKEKSPEEKAQEQKAIQAQLSQSSNAFAINFYRTLAQEERSSNLCFSPLNISTSFWMTYSGAKNRTSEELSRVFQLPIEAKKVQENYTGLLEALSQDAQERAGNDRDRQSQVRFQNANSLFITTTRPLFSEKFKELLKTHYQAEISQALVNQNAQEIINNWISKNTQDLIPEFLSQLNPNNAAKNINALSVKGRWETTFARNQGRKQDFMAFNWRKVPTEFVQQTNNFRLIEEERYQLISLPLQNSSLALQILLPNKDEALSKIEEDFNVEQFNQWQTQLKETAQMRVQLSLPKLALKSGIPLNVNLKKLGLKSIFLPEKADLGGMEINSGDIFFGEDIKTQSTLSIEENQLSFAAVTAVSFQQSPKPLQVQADKPAAPKKFQANRPFLFWVTETKSNTILLLGRYLRPEQEE